MCRIGKNVARTFENQISATTKILVHQRQSYNFALSCDEKAITQWNSLGKAIKLLPLNF